MYACIAVQELTFACLRKKKKATNRYKSVNDLLVCSRESQTLSEPVDVADCAD